MLPDFLQEHLVSIEHCPLCGSQEIKALFLLNETRIFRCSACRFRFMNPYLSEKGMSVLYGNSELLAEVNPALLGYYEAAVSFEGSKTQKDYIKTLETMEKIVEGRKLFEVGFGSGAFLLEAKNRGWTVSGIDSNQKNSDDLLREKNLPVVTGDFASYESSQKDYDIVAMWDVIEHTVEPRLFLKKAKTMLRPGGLLVLATPNIGGLLNRIAEFLYFVSCGNLKFAAAKLYVTEHVGYYTEVTLRRLVQAEGFIPRKVFLTESDLERYSFPKKFIFILKILFWLARLVRQQNRIILIAQKDG